MPIQAIPPPGSGSPPPVGTPVPGSGGYAPSTQIYQQPVGMTPEYQQLQQTLAQLNARQSEVQQNYNFYIRELQTNPNLTQGQRENYTLYANSANAELSANREMIALLQQGYNVPLDQAQIYARQAVAGAERQTINEIKANVARYEPQPIRVIPNEQGRTLTVVESNVNQPSVTHTKAYVEGREVLQPQQKAAVIEYTESANAYDRANEYLKQQANKIAEASRNVNVKGKAEYALQYLSQVKKELQIMLGKKEGTRAYNSAYQELSKPVSIRETVTAINTNEDAYNSYVSQVQAQKGVIVYGTNLTPFGQPEIIGYKTSYQATEVTKPELTFNPLQPGSFRLKPAGQVDVTKEIEYSLRNAMLSEARGVEYVPELPPIEGEYQNRFVRGLNELGKAVSIVSTAGLSYLDYSTTLPLTRETRAQYFPGLSTATTTPGAATLTNLRTSVDFGVKLNLAQESANIQENMGRYSDLVEYQNKLNVSLAEGKINQGEYNAAMAKVQADPAYKLIAGKGIGTVFEDVYPSMKSIKDITLKDIAREGPFAFASTKLGYAAETPLPSTIALFTPVGRALTGGKVIGEGLATATTPGSVEILDVKVPRYIIGGAEIVGGLALSGALDKPIGMGIKAFQKSRLGMVNRLDMSTAKITRASKTPFLEAGFGEVGLRAPVEIQRGAIPAVKEAFWSTRPILSTGIGGVTGVMTYMQTGDIERSIGAGLGVGAGIAIPSFVMKAWQVEAYPMKIKKADLMFTKEGGQEMVKKIRIMTETDKQFLMPYTESAWREYQQTGRITQGYRVYQRWGYDINKVATDFYNKYIGSEVRNIQPVWGVESGSKGMLFADVKWKGPTPGSLQGSKEAEDIVKGVGMGRKPVGQISLVEDYARFPKTDLPYKEVIRDGMVTRFYYRTGSEKLVAQAMKLSGTTPEGAAKLGGLFGYSDAEVNQFFARGTRMGFYDIKPVISGETGLGFEATFVPGKLQPYIPKPIYGGVPYGYEIPYGFGGKQTYTVGRAEAISQRKYVVGMMQEQGLSYKQASELFQYTPARNFLTIDKATGIIVNPKLQEANIWGKVKGDKFLIPLETTSTITSPFGAKMTLVAPGFEAPAGASGRYIFANLGDITSSPFAKLVGGYSTKETLRWKEDWSTQLKNVKTSPEMRVWLENRQALVEEGLGKVYWKEETDAFKILKGGRVVELKPTYMNKVLTPQARITEVRGASGFGRRIASLDDTGKLVVNEMKSSSTLDLINPPAGDTIITDIVKQEARGTAYRGGKVTFLTDVSSTNLQFTSAEKPVYNRIVVEPTSDPMFFKKTTYRYGITGGTAEIGGNVNELVSGGRVELLGTKEKFFQAGKELRDINILTPSTPDLLRGVKGGTIGSGPMAGDYKLVYKSDGGIVLSRSGKIGSPVTVFSGGSPALFGRVGGKGIGVVEGDYGDIFISKAMKPTSIPLDISPSVSTTRKLPQGLGTRTVFTPEEGGAGGGTTGMFTLTPTEETFIRPETRAMFKDLAGIQMPAPTMQEITGMRTVSIPKFSEFELHPLEGLKTFARASSVPILSPISTPIMTPISTPVLTPIMTPILTPVVEPVLTPIITPVMTPVLTPIVTPIVTPIITPVITPTIVPTPTIFPNTNIFPAVGGGWFGKSRLFEQKKKKRPAYSVFVKKKGVFAPVAMNLPRGKALRFGSTVAMKELSRTFKIKEAGFTSEPDINFAPPKDIFRTYQVKKGKAIDVENMWIQRQNRSLSTNFERAALQQARAFKVKKNKFFG